MQLTETVTIINKSGKVITNVSYQTLFGPRASIIPLFSRASDSARLP